jgi:precorrin-2 dehydrogenase / sirohydrochlorin ferrochelatase
MKTTNTYYPIFFRLAGRKCKVLGGGQVAFRKVNLLLKSGAQVEVISPIFGSGLTRLIAEKKIKAKTRAYQNGDLKKAFLVFAATDDPAVNLEVAREARKRGISVNMADDASGSDFIVPSIVSRRNVTIAISTSGKSPALARKIRTSLEEEFGEEYDLLAAMVEEIRQELKQRKIQVSSENWQNALDLDLLTTFLKKGEREKAKETLKRNLGIN